METKARLWKGPLAFITLLIFFTGSQVGKALVVKQKGTASLKNVSVSTEQYSTQPARAILSHTRSETANNLTLVTESNLIKWTSSALTRSRHPVRTVHPQDQPESRGRQANPTLVRESNLNQKWASPAFTRGEPLKTVDRQGRKENPGRQGNIQFINPSNLLNWTTSMSTRSEPQHTVDHQESPESQGNLMQHGTTAVSDLCSARMIPGFSANVSGIVSFYGGTNFHQSTTYRVVAVGPPVFDDLWPCYQAKSHSSDTVKFVFRSFYEFCRYGQIQLPLVFVNLLTEHCPTAHLMDIFKYPNGVTFEISEPKVDERLRINVRGFGRANDSCLRCVFFSAFSADNESVSQVNYTSVNQGICHVLNCSPPP